MSSASHFEIDFFLMEKQIRQREFAPSPKPSSPESASSPVRGIQGVVSRISPQLLRTIVATEQARGFDPVTVVDHPAAAAWPTSASNPPSPCRTSTPVILPVYNPASSGCSGVCPPPVITAPLTIFYNGSVTTINVSHDKAEIILRLAEAAGLVVGSPAEQQPGDSMSHGRDQVIGYLPIKRSKSLQRFFEKRKERLSAASSPYDRSSKTCPRPSARPS